MVRYRRINVQLSLPVCVWKQGSFIIYNGLSLLRHRQQAHTHSTWKIRCGCRRRQQHTRKKNFRLNHDGKSKHRIQLTRESEKERGSGQTNSPNGPMLMQNVFQTACIFKVLSLFRRSAGLVWSMWATVLFSLSLSLSFSVASNKHPGNCNKWQRLMHRLD